MFAVLGGTLLIVCRRIGLAPHDVAIACAVGLYALLQRRWDRRRTQLLGESENPAPVRWADFMREHHQLTGCVVRGRRRRSERILALAVSTLALLYWKAIFRPPPVSMSSMQGLRSSLYTLFASKVVQQLMKQGIRIAAGRTVAWQANAGWLETLHLQWLVLQYWVVGFMLLCVGLFLRDGWRWWSLLSRWLVNMAFALVVMDLAFCYLRYTLYCAFKSRISGL